LAIVELGKLAGLNKRLHDDYPFYEAEILYAIRSEMAQKPNDIVCRRVPISFLDSEQTKSQVLPKVVEIMAKELKWSSDRKSKELAEAQQNLHWMK
jgi:glycerol-3-phosphate dehydrogenase